MWGRESLRLADNGVVISYRIATDKGYNTTRHRRFLRSLAAEHDPKKTKTIRMFQNRVHWAKLKYLLTWMSKLMMILLIQQSNMLRNLKLGPGDLHI